MDPSPVGIGHRIYEVRRALGPDARHEMPQRQFAELLNRRAKELFAATRGSYDSSVIARLEKGARKVTVQDITVVASVDPLSRGLLWLGWGEARQLSDEEIAHARATRTPGLETPGRTRLEPPADPPARVAAGGPRHPKRQRGKR